MTMRKMQLANQREKDNPTPPAPKPSADELRAGFGTLTAEQKEIIEATIANLVEEGKVSE